MFLVGDDSDLPADDTALDMREETTTSSLDHLNVKGSLVQQLEDTKEYLEEGVTTSTLDNNFRPTSSSVPGSADFLKTQEVEKLRQSLQSLSRSANPLARLVDALQEDLESMLTEVRMWEEEYEKNTRQLNEEHNSIDQEMQELSARLNDLRKQVQEANDNISMSKELIERQEEKMRRVMSALVVPKGPVNSKTGVRTLHRP